MTAEESLEFHQVLGIIGGYLSFEAGKKALGEAFFLPKSVIEERYRQISKLSRLLEKGVDIPFDGIPPILKILDKVKIGSALTPKELLSIAKFIEADETIYERLLGTGVEGLPDPLALRSIKREILKRIDEDGNVRDDASPELYKIREEWRTVRRKVLILMDNLLKEYAQKGILRDHTVTIKNGRLVLPFASHIRPRGVVHAFSQTQETIFVEPLEAIDLQNKMVRLKEEENKEVARILRELRDSVAFHHDLIMALFESLGNLELLYAMAKFKADYGATLPRLRDDGHLLLEGALHPILLRTKREEEVVPLDLILPSNTKVFLISGPNAGGKTVSLKTVGLAVLMAMYGMPVLARRAEITLPNRVFAIGFEDEQNIEAGESSFTALLHDIREALFKAQEGDFVFLDELLGSTDPDEGAALAFSVLKTFASRGVKVLANTHLARLKALVSKEEGMLNATMEFDPKTKRPTYRMLTGEVGESYALEIAKREGLPDELIQEAESILLEMGREVQVLSRRLREKELEVEELSTTLKERMNKFEREREKLLRQAKLKATRITEEALFEVETLLKELKKAQKKERLEGKIKIAKKTREKLRDMAQIYDLYGEPVKSPVIGETYRVRPFGFTGELKELKGDVALLLVGKRKITVPKKSLYEVT